MAKPLHILLIEDSEDDAELLLRQLRKVGYEPSAHRVATAEALSEALGQEPWDVIISDYVMPGFGGLEALEIFHERGLDIPFIVVSGHIGEELAVAAMKAGADDYLMKDRLARLEPALQRALEDAEIRRAHKRANEALRESEERFRQLAENVGAVFFMFESPAKGSTGTVSYVSPAFQSVWGLPCESLKASSDLWLKAVHREDRERVGQALQKVTETNLSLEFRILRMDLKVRWVYFRTFPVRNEAGAAYRVAAVAEDITERKRAEEMLAANASELRSKVDELRATEEKLREKNEQLTQAREQLERRVQERTADLALANSELKEQMVERKRLETELLEIAENERRRIGFDLHDDLGQKLLGISMLLKALETRLTNKKAAEAAETKKIQALIQEVVNHTHNLAHCFSSLDANGTNILEQMKKLGENVKKTFHIGCTFRTVGDVPEVKADVAAQLCKIAEESINNAIKHGKASRVTLLLARQNGELMLRIKNDGVPYQAPSGPTNRLGLRIMNYRAHLIGGTVNICANGNSGTLVTCSIPMPVGNHPRSSGAVHPTKSVAKSRNGVAARVAM